MGFCMGTELGRARHPRRGSTVDIDLLGTGGDNLEHIASLVSKICGLEPEADGSNSRPLE